jgi:RNA polymerase sigma factor (sigma-70 family)
VRRVHDDSRETAKSRPRRAVPRARRRRQTAARSDECLELPHAQLLLSRDDAKRPRILTDENQELPDEAAEMTLRNEALQRILHTLSSRQRQVLELRFGLDGQHPRTLDEVGRTFNVTRERVRQIENQGLRKLRALADAAKLRDAAA